MPPVSVSKSDPLDLFTLLPTLAPVDRHVMVPAGFVKVSGSLSSSARTAVVKSSVQAPQKESARSLVEEANAQVQQTIHSSMLHVAKGPHVNVLPVRDPSAYSCNAVICARWLLGSRLVRLLPNGQRLSGRIVECEAYLGPLDRAAHSYGGKRTERNESMYLSGGTLYVYLIYGMFHCLNITCGAVGDPTAVLVRALHPEEGIEEMLVRRLNRPVSAKRVQPPIRTEVTEADRKRLLPTLTSGPGRLCQALGVDRTHDRLSLLHESQGELWLEHGEAVPSQDVVVSPRVGVDYAGEWSKATLRFCIRDDPYVSKPWPWRLNEGGEGGSSDGAKRGRKRRL